MQIHIKKHTPLIIAIIVVLLFGGVYGALSGMLFDHQTIIKSLEQSSVSEDVTWSTTRNVMHTMEETASSRAEIMTFIMHEKDIVGFIGTMEDAAKHAGVGFELKALNVTNEGENSRLSVSVMAKGSWKGVRYFFSLLEALPIHMSILKIRMEQSDSSDNVWVGSVDFDVINFQK